MLTPVEEVMMTDVVAVTEEAAYKGIVELMHGRHVVAVPVLDAAGQVRGVVSQTDLVVKETGPDAGETVHFSLVRRAEQRKAMGVVARDLMTAPPVTVSAAATVRERVIAGEFAMEPDRFEVSVSAGRVVLGGKVEWRSQVGSLLHAVRYVEGVVSATSRLEYRTDDTYAAAGPYL